MLLYSNTGSKVDMKCILMSFIKLLIDEELMLATHKINVIDDNLINQEVISVTENYLQLLPR